MTERGPKHKRAKASLAPRAVALGPPPPIAFPEPAPVVVQSPLRFPAAVVGGVLALGVTDFVLGLYGLVSVALTIALSVALVPWAMLVFQRAEVGLAGVRRFRALGQQIANGVLVIGALAAKWLTLMHALDVPASGLAPSYKSYTAVLTVLMVLGVLLRSGRVNRWVAASARHPARLMVMSFGLSSSLGALLLALPVCVRHVGDVSLLDSWFMATSAVCVTGLSTVNVAETYTFVGQLVILLLMQVGGLGIMVLTAAVTLLAGRRLDVKSSAVLVELVDARSLADLRRTVAMIVSYTLLFEAIGALLLYPQFRGLPDTGQGSAAWASVFHSVSAFCNAGLSTFRDGVLPFSSSIAVCQILAALVVLGGLGFPVMHELFFRGMCRLRGLRSPRATLNTRLALVTSAMLFAGMAIAYFALESSASFASLGFVDRMNAAFFQSASARSGGFNAVDIAAMRPATLLLTCFAMFIGGNPGSISGGIKTTTLAVLFAAYRGELRRHRPRLLDRTLPEAVIRRAMGVAFLSTTLVLAIVFLLLLVERHDSLALLFEAVSAFSTAGLSTGITASLGVPGKLLILLTMLIGRVGPLTMALALSATEKPRLYELPEERVMIG